MLDHANTALLSTDHIHGADVYGAGEERIGHIDHLLIDGTTGRIAYAIMGFGGFLGLGEELRPIPWAALRYDHGLDGYVTGITVDQLQSSPRAEEGWARDRAWEERTFSHFGAPAYWL